MTLPVGTCVLVAKGAADEGWARWHGAGLRRWDAKRPKLRWVAVPSRGGLHQSTGHREICSPLWTAGRRRQCGAVAAALDQGPYALPFTDIDLIYKKLDLLNFGDPEPLREVLVQLDGEIYADVSSIVIGASQLYLGALR